MLSSLSTASASYSEFPQNGATLSFLIFPLKGQSSGVSLNPIRPEKYTLTDHRWKYLRDYADKHRAAGNGFGFGLVNERDSARTLSARYHKDGSEILIAQKRGKNPRRLTPRECARLMGYPDAFKIVVSDTQAYRQFGNSVVVPVVERIAHGVLQTLQRSLNTPADFALTAAEKPTRQLSRRPRTPVTYSKPKRTSRKRAA